MASDLRTLEDIDGVGSGRAEVLRAEGYATPGDLADAKRDELLSITGVGESLADDIIAAVEGLESESMIADEAFRVTGRITTGDDEGVHGLTVEVWDDEVVNDRLAETRTRPDGTFSVTLHESTHPELLDRLGDSASALFVRVRDRDGELVYDEERRHDYAVGTTVRLARALGDDALANHLSRPTTLKRSTGSLVPDSVYDDIDEAIRLVVSPDSPETAHEDTSFRSMRRASRCPNPPIDRFDSVVEDAWGTIDGDPGATDRFQNALETTILRSSDGCGCGEAHVTEDQIRTLFDPERTGAADFGADEERVGTRESFVGRETALPLFAAAIYASGGDRQKALQYTTTIARQICQAEVVGSLHRAAVGALDGDELERGHLRDSLGVVGADCGPIDGPGGGDDGGGVLPPPQDLPCNVPFDEYDFFPCLDDYLQRVLDAGATFSGEIYVINDVSPDRACPGDRVTISGSGFEYDPGAVYFDEVDGSGVEGRVVSWSDSEITVVVPNGAVCGVRLSIVANTASLCGETLTSYKRGKFNDNFDGTSAFVEHFRIDGSNDEIHANPLDDITLSWDTCAADHVAVEILDESNTVIAESDPAPAKGTWTHSLGDYDETTTLTARIRVSGQCSPTRRQEQIPIVVHEVPNLQIDGLEVTQAIQHYDATRHLTDPSDRGPDNSVQLVSGKTAYVRAYFRSGQDPFFNGGEVEDVTGQLTVEQFNNGQWVTVQTLSPQNNGGSVTARANPSYQTERGNLGQTLNFAVPAATMRGQVRFSLDASAPDAHEDTVTDGDDETVSVQLQQQLQLAGIMVNYNGPNRSGNNVQLPAPTQNDLRQTATLSYEILPVRRDRVTDFRVAGRLTQRQPLTDSRTPNSGCTPNWDALVSNVRQVMTADNNRQNWVFVGFLPQNIPRGPVIGCGGGGVGTARNTAQATLAHEVGHALGLAHAPGGTPAPSDVDSNYPNYQPYGRTSIGEYGLRIPQAAGQNPTVQSPRTDGDFMSYMRNTWISLYHHNQLLNVNRLQPTQIAPRTEGDAEPRKETTTLGAYQSREEMPPRPYVSVMGRVTGEESAEVDSVARLTTRPLEDGEPTDVVAELVGEGEEVLAEGVVYAISTTPLAEGGRCACGGGDPTEPPFQFHAFVPDDSEEPGTQLRLRRGETVLWSRTAPEEPPVVEGVDADVEQDVLEIQWDVQLATHRQPEAWIRWSDDEGETWNALTVDVRESGTRIDVSHLPSGSVRFQVLVNDGFYTSSTVTDPVEIPPRPPEVEVLHPQTGTVFASDSPLRLHGVATDSADNAVPEEAYVWSIDGEQVAEGTDRQVENPGPGTHTATLTVETEGGEARDSVTFEVAEESP